MTAPHVVEARNMLRTKGVDTRNMTDEEVLTRAAQTPGVGVKTPGGFSLAADPDRASLGGLIGDIIQQGARAGLNPLDKDSWAGIGQVASRATMTQMAKISPDFAGFLGSIPGPTMQTIQNDIAKGNWGGVATAAVVGGLVPYAADQMVAYVSKKVGQTLGLIPPAPVDRSLDELTLDDLNSAAADRGRTPELGNIGHRGHMEVFLGPKSGGRLRFEIPPATQSVLPIGLGHGHGGGQGRQTPGAHAGISFKHVQNFATLMVPGSSPIYQSLGIQGHMIEFVGVFLGFNHNKHLNSSKHEAESFGPADASGRRSVLLSDHFNPNNPDPLYLNTPGDKSQWGSILGNAPKLGTGGAWGISKAFEQHVEAGLPQEFEIYSGVARIRYNVIVLSLERIYERDDRVWYRFQALAVDGSEADDYYNRVAASKKHALPGRTRDGRKSVGTGTVKPRVSGTAAAAAAPGAPAAKPPASPAAETGTSMMLLPDGAPLDRLQELVGKSGGRNDAGFYQSACGQAMENFNFFMPTLRAFKGRDQVGGGKILETSELQQYEEAYGSYKRFEEVVARAGKAYEEGEIFARDLNQRRTNDGVGAEYLRQIQEYRTNLIAYQNARDELAREINTILKPFTLPAHIKRP